MGQTLINLTRLKTLDELADAASESDGLLAVAKPLGAHLDKLPTLHARHGVVPKAVSAIQARFDEIGYDYDILAVALTRFNPWANQRKPSTQKVEALREAFEEGCKGLTPGEQFAVLADILTRNAGYVLREERK